MDFIVGVFSIEMPEVGIVEPNRSNFRDVF